LTGEVAAFDERFTSGELDTSRWIAAYLPAWSSRAAAAATYDLSSDGLRLSIPTDQPAWCPGLHDDPPLRVSAVQSGNRSGAVGTALGQQPFRNGLVVTEAQDELRGFVPLYGRVEVQCRAEVAPGSMFSAWMIGMEDQPHRCGEICLVEVFGDTIADCRAAVGSGIHAFRDPGLTEEFSAVPRDIDVAEWHGYAVEWRPDGVKWFIDGECTRTSEQSPAYPMLLILGVFDFPGISDTAFEPKLTVRRVVGSADSRVPQVR
jgi:Glycosyl hydrolases family 16